MSLELSDTGQVLSQEEYLPYGSTVFSASSQSLKVLKRYRFSSKELDTETGLYYFENRYLMPWLGRWLSPDPAGLGDGCNVWAYCGGNPVSKVDMTGLGGGASKMPSGGDAGSESGGRAGVEREAEKVEVKGRGWTMTPPPPSPPPSTPPPLLLLLHRLRLPRRQATVIIRPRE